MGFKIKDIPAVVKHCVSTGQNSEACEDCLALCHKGWAEKKAGTTDPNWCLLDNVTSACPYDMFREWVTPSDDVAMIMRVIAEKLEDRIRSKADPMEILMWELTEEEDDNKETAK